MNDGLQGTKLTQIIPYIPSVVSQTLTSKLFRALPAQVKLTQSDETTAWCSQILGSDKRAGDQLSWPPFFGMAQEKLSEYRE